MPPKDIIKIVNKLKERPWKKEDFKKQNWGVWLHSISSYVGRIKPSFAHWLISTCSEKEDVILDPFCGIGTVVLESDLLGRSSIGIDLNPYATLIAKSKLDRNGLENEISYLEKIELNTDSVDLSNIPLWVKEYYHKKTLKEIIALRNQFLRDKKYFLLGCLLGISHGHRPQHLSIRTGYIIPYLPNPKPKKQYRKVVPRLIQKVKRMHKDYFPLKTNSKIIEADSRYMPLETSSIDVVISSPPYYNTLDYVQTNKLRLALMGYGTSLQNTLKLNLIQNKKTYLEEMDKVADELKRVVKKDGLIIFVLGDVHTPTYSLNTAEDISKLYAKKGFNTNAIIEDEIPANRTTIIKFNGKKAIKHKKRKMDRILVMTLK